MRSRSLNHCCTTADATAAARLCTKKVSGTLPAVQKTWSPRTPKVPDTFFVQSHAALEDALAKVLKAHEQARASGMSLLTDAGVSYIRQLLVPNRKNGSPTRNGDAHAGLVEGRYLLPSWDADSRCLWLGDRLLKRFRQPAPNQTKLLEVFEEQGWIDAHVDDPLPPADGETVDDTKRRLHETLKNLNRNLPSGTIRFRGDGTGQGASWEYDAQIIRASPVSAGVNSGLR